MSEQSWIFSMVGAFLAESTSAPRMLAARSPTRLLLLLLGGSLSAVSFTSEALREPELSTRSDDAGAKRRLAMREALET